MPCHETGKLVVISITHKRPRELVLEDVLKGFVELTAAQENMVFSIDSYGDS